MCIYTRANNTTRYSVRYSYTCTRVRSIDKSKREKKEEKAERTDARVCTGSVFARARKIYETLDAGQRASRGNFQLYTCCTCVIRRDRKE